MSSVPPTDAVVLSIDHTSYTPSSTINVTLINHRSTSIFTFDHQTSCTILTLQRQTTNGWVATGGCALGRMTQRSKSSRTHMQIALAPGAGQMHATPWPAGTYRVILNYALQAQNISATTQLPPRCLLSGKSSLASACIRFHRYAAPGATTRCNLAAHPRGVYNRGVAAHGRQQAQQRQQRR